jgi:hypothetical protein
MRIGSNPIKDDYKIVINNYHRIVMPVYIPHFEGYFENAFEVFKLCLESLLMTIHDKSRITIYNNNCHENVKKYIDEKYKESIFIDQVFHSKENLGKVNAILASVKGNLEPLITITDADVLFKNGWQEAVEETFIQFPHAGTVSPVPTSKVFKTFTGNNWYYGFVKGSLRFENVQDPDAMHKFDISLGNKELMFKPIHLKKYLVLTSKKTNVKAVMGCGHFVATLKRDVFDKGSNTPALIKIVGGVESVFIDAPNEKLGMLRLATPKNYAFHMGNTVQQWMIDEFQILTYKKSNSKYESIQFSSLTIPRIGNYFGCFFQKLLNNKKFRIFFLSKIGLSKEEASQY